MTSQMASSIEGLIPPTVLVMDNNNNRYLAVHLFGPNLIELISVARMLKPGEKIPGPIPPEVKASVRMYYAPLPIHPTIIFNDEMAYSESGRIII